MGTSVFLDIIFFSLSGAHANLDYEQSLFFLGPSSKTPETRKWPRALLKARDGRGLVSRVSRLRRSTLARACTPLTKSEEKERLLAV